MPICDCLMWLGLVLAVYCFPHVGALSVSQLYPFGVAAEDEILGPSDEGSSSGITLTTPFIFFGTPQSVVYVNTNGLLSFDMLQPPYLPTPFSLTNQPLVAPFWGDVDTRSSGEVSYRQTSDQALLAQVGMEIRRSFVNSRGFFPTSLFIATWNDVGYYDNHADLTNTFQVVLATNGNMSFAIFEYADLQWASADPRTDISSASGSTSGSGSGSGSGRSNSRSGSEIETLDVVLAQVGFSAGNGSTYHTLNGSGTDEVLQLNSTSNVGRAGVWIFRVDESTVEPGALCTNGSVRLLVGEGYSYYYDETDYNDAYYQDAMSGSGLLCGRVEVCISGVYGTVCDDSWDNQDASVVCRQLGFSPYGAIAVSGQTFGELSLSFLAGGVNCSGDEPSLLSCPHTPSPVCSQYSDAGVVCQELSTRSGNCADGMLRLVGGTNLLEGRVEICINNAWGTVCDNSFGMPEAQVVCVQLEFSRTNATSFRRAQFGQGSGPIFLSQLGCVGTEESLLDCPSFARPGLHVCDHSEDAGVRCADINQCAESNGGCAQQCTNLVPGFECSCNPGYRLGRDGTSCSDINECAVNNGGCQHSCVNRDGSFSCECLPGYDLVNNTNCSVCVNGSVRLVGSSVSGEGTVEICVNGMYGTVCDDRWDELEASVVCRQLGYGGQSSIPVRGGVFSNGSGSILLDELRCAGSESSLLECGHEPVGVHDCSHSEDAGVRCGATCTEGSVRLVVSDSVDAYYRGDTDYDAAYYDKDGLTRGRVEVCINGTYGTVCDDSWDNQDASVVCRQLGFSPYGAIAVSAETFGEGSASRLLSRADCVGNESSLLQCPTTQYSGGGCVTSGVVCQAISTPSGNCSTGNLRLVGGSDNLLQGTREGRVEICINNAWGTVCDSLFGDIDASVACYHLGGFSRQGAQFLRATYAPGSGPIFLDQLDCIGTEDNLLQCSARHPLGLQVMCDHSEDVGIRCQDIDECSTNNGGCDHYCNNTIGSFMCSCMNGFSLLGDGMSCIDINECENDELNNCSENANCTNTEGSFTCSCNPGYTGDGVNCTNINECELEIYPCHSNANCTDTDGSFNCTCVAGFEGDGFNCTDIPECVRGLDECDMNATCINTVGSYDCMCNTGFTGNGFTCTDIDECMTEMDDCDVNATCNNTFGSFECTCDAGFEGNGVNCTNIDECELDIDNCHVNATCADVIGSFDCTCNRGFEGDGVTCINIDECVRGTHQCDVNGNCTDNIGSYDCVCRSGYEGDGFNCTDIDECERGTHLCVNAECMNTIGSYTCGPCFPGFRDRDATTCICSNGDIRLMNGTEPSVREGRVEICYDNSYGTVCDDRWDIVDASVVCRQLGFRRSEDAVPLRGAYFGSGNDSILLDNVVCRGTELSLLQCNTNPVGRHNCDHSEDAGVRCEASCIEGDVRLLTDEGFQDYYNVYENDDIYYNKDALTRGRVEVCINGTYSTVCDDSWDNQDASVVCRQLGFSSYGAVALPSGFFPGRLDTHLTDVRCNGSEYDLLSCLITISGQCTSNEDAAVVCQDRTTPAGNCIDGVLRLVGGNNPLEGRVEICINNAWGTVCDDGFSSEDAQVVCNQLGDIFNGSVAFRSAFFGSGSGPIFLDQLSCIGTEANLLQCRARPTGLHDCSHNKDAGVRCIDYNECLISNGNCSQICVNEIPGFHCECESGQTLHPDGVTCIANAQCSGSIVENFTCMCFPGYQDVTGSGLNCTDINECESRNDVCDENAQCVNTDGSFDCTCNQGFFGNGTICTCFNGDVVLVNGTNVTEGRVEICINNTYGTVCDDRWNVPDARVVCRQLGYSVDDVVALGRAYFGSGSGEIYLDSVVCNGSEGTLLQCTASPVGVHNCDHSEDAGVRCGGILIFSFLPSMYINSS